MNSTHSPNITVTNVPKADIMIIGSTLAYVAMLGISICPVLGIRYDYCITLPPHTMTVTITVVFIQTAVTCLWYCVIFDCYFSVFVHFFVPIVGEEGGGGGGTIIDSTYVLVWYYWYYIVHNTFFVPIACIILAPRAVIF